MGSAILQRCRADGAENGSRGAARNYFTFSETSVERSIRLPAASTTVGVTNTNRLLGPTGMFVESGSQPPLGSGSARTKVWPGNKVTWLVAWIVFTAGCEGSPVGCVSFARDPN